MASNSPNPTSSAAANVSADLIDDLPECERFHGTARSLCRGETDQPAVYVNRWRKAFGLPPRFTDASQHQSAITTKCGQAPAVAKPRGKPGTKFKALADSLNVPEPEGCDCKAVRIEM